MAHPTSDEEDTSRKPHENRRRKVDERRTTKKENEKTHARLHDKRGFWSNEEKGWRYKKMETLDMRNLPKAKEL